MKRGAGNRKGQITIFVIIGIVLLIMGYGVFLLVKSAGQAPEEAAAPVPEEFKPVQNYVEACIHSIGIEGIRKLGEHGGYIEPLNPAINPIKLKYIESDKSASDLVSIGGTSDTLVPYYIHVPGRATPENFNYYSAAPGPEVIEYQLARYVEAKLPACLGNFRELEDSGYEVSTAANPIVQVAMQGDEVRLYLDQETNISNAAAKVSITRYNTVIRFPLLKYYIMAYLIAGTEHLSQFEESFTSALVNYYSGADFNKLPPIVEHNSLPYVVTWNQNKVRSDFDTLLSSYVPALQVNGTKGFRQIADSGDIVEDAFFRSTMLDIFDSNMSDELGLGNTSITFIYRPGSVSLRVNPSEGSTIRPAVEFTKGSKYIPEQKSFTYRFFYDISYPLFVEIRGAEPESEIPEFSWLFAIESNLIENKAPVAWQAGLGTVEWDTGYINTTVSFPPGSVVGEDGQPVDDVTSISGSKSLFCDQATWKSGEATTTVFDADDDPLEGVNVGFGCGDHALCYVGQTGEAGKWAGRLPLCIGGFVTLSKDGYSSRKIPVSTGFNSPVWIPSQSLYQATELQAFVKKRQVTKDIYRDDDWVWRSGAAGIGAPEDVDAASEQVMVTLTQLDSADDQSQTVIFGKDSLGEQTVSLVPGEYEVTATLLDHSGITIPKECSRFCKTSVGICLSHEYVPPDDVVIDTVPWGGLSFERGEAGTITITPEMLASGSRIDFTVMKLPNLQDADPAGGCLEHLDEMEKLREYTGQFRAEVEPVIS